MVDDLYKLRESLRDMPVPEPSPDFVDRVLANATLRPPTRGGAMRAAVRRPATWWAAGVGALAATLACVALLWRQPAAPEPQFVLALNENREVSLVINSERELDDATIRLYVTGSVALAGYEQQHEIEWQTSLTRGANLLSLPVVGLAPGDGRLVAEIEHNGRTRRLSVVLRVIAGGQSAGDKA